MSGTGRRNHRLTLGLAAGATGVAALALLLVPSPSGEGGATGERADDERVVSAALARIEAESRGAAAPPAIRAAPRSAGNALPAEPPAERGPTPPEGYSFVTDHGEMARERLRPGAGRASRRRRARSRLAGRARRRRRPGRPGRHRRPRLDVRLDTASAGRAGGRPAAVAATPRRRGPGHRGPPWFAPGYRATGAACGRSRRCRRSPGSVPCPGRGSLRRSPGKPPPSPGTSGRRCSLP